LNGFVEGCSEMIVGHQAICLKYVSLLIEFLSMKALADFECPLYA
jgi:hypothetical protein